jgi:hypothetical protein
MRLKHILAELDELIYQRPSAERMLWDDYATLQWYGRVRAVFERLEGGVRSEMKAIGVTRAPFGVKREISAKMRLLLEAARHEWRLRLSRSSTVSVSAAIVWYVCWPAANVRLGWCPPALYSEHFGGRIEQSSTRQQESGDTEPTSQLAWDF